MSRDKFQYIPSIFRLLLFTHRSRAKSLGFRGSPVPMPPPRLPRAMSYKVVWVFFPINVHLINLNLAQLRQSGCNVLDCKLYTLILTPTTLTPMAWGISRNEDG